MARGPSPKPAAVAQAQGNPGRRRIGADPAPADDAQASSAPDWLSPGALAVWTRLAPELTRLRLLSRADGLTFGRYCQLFALWLEAKAGVDLHGIVVTTTSEHVTMDRMSKHLHAMLLLEKRLEDHEDRFGLNPANRQRIYAQRAAAGAGAPGAGGELFPDDAASKPPKPSAPAGPVGLLN